MPRMVIAVYSRHQSILQDTNGVDQVANGFYVLKRIVGDSNVKAALQFALELLALLGCEMIILVELRDDFNITATYIEHRCHHLFHASLHLSRGRIFRDRLYGPHVGIRTRAI